MAALTEAASAVGSTIGRYFSVVSMLPSTLLVGWVAILLAGGAGSGNFAPTAAWQAARSVTVGEVAVFATVALAISLVLNPFQFAATQFLEGYWGKTQLGSTVAANRTNHHRRSYRRMWKDKTKAGNDLKRRAEAHGTTEHGLLLGAAGDRSVGLQARADSLNYEISLYPETARIMPTRLGNALRSFEDRAGREYGLDILKVAGHLSLLPGNQRTAYVRDTRESLDLSVRLCGVFGLATLVSCLLLAREGWWVLLALVPYTAAYLSYRGAVFAALGYGNAVRFQIDLDRFAFYEAMHVPEPTDTDREREQNAMLMALLSRDPRAWASTTVRYGPGRAQMRNGLLGGRASRPKG